MKRLSTKVTYPLVIFTILVSIAFQVIWLRQVFLEQRLSTVHGLEDMLAQTAQNNLYNSISKDVTRHNNFQQFLLSPQWVQIRQGFDDVKGDSSYKSFSMTETADSAQIAMQFVFMKKARKKVWKPKRSFEGKLPQVLFNDSLSLLNMKQAVENGLAELNVIAPHYIVLHHYSAKADEALPRGMKRIRADFISNSYSYDFDHLYKYQLVIPSLNFVVWYKMRYYLGSSFFMVVLTIVAFYYIFKLMRKTKLYADAKVAFTSNITHEIKTPLATVSLAIESITKYGLTDKPEILLSYLDISRQEIQRLNVLVEKVLNLNKEPGDFKLSCELLDVQLVIAEALHAMEIQFKEADGHYNFLSSPEPCFIEADQVHLSNVFYNLIENALKYSTGRPDLIVTCTQIRDRMIITFADNGPGIPVEYRNKVFDRFFRIPQKGDRHQVSGTGLGLNYVKEIVTAHQGTILVKSDKGKGSTFIINLPATKDEL